MNKICSTCHGIFPRSRFSRNKSTRDGLQWSCRLCDKVRRRRARDAGRIKYDKEKMRIYNREYRANHKEKLIAAAKAKYRRYKLTQPEKIAAKSRYNYYVRKARNLERTRTLGRQNAARYAAAHPERIRAMNARYRAEHPEVNAIHRARRRARRLGASGNGWTVDDVLAVKKAQRGRCALCRCRLGDNFHRDHIKPLSRGGPHDRKNLQLLCPPCNLRKSSKDPIDHAQSIGLLL